MKQGFSLLELIISLALATIISSLLYTSFSTILQFSTYGSSRIDLDVRTALFLHQLEKDVTGIFLPLEALPDEPKDTAKKTPEKKSRKIIEHPCYALNKAGMLSLFTFITNNPLPSYQFSQKASEQPKAGTPFITRITYTVEKEADKKDCYRIARSATSDLAFHAQPKGYEIINNVKTVQLSFMRPQANPPAKKAPEKNSKKKEKEDTASSYERFALWPPEKKSNAENIDLPHIITVKIVLWDENHDKDYTIEAHMPTLILPQLYPFEEEDEADKANPNQPPVAPTTPAIHPTQGTA